MPGRYDAEGEHDGRKGGEDGHEDALGDEHAVVGHLEDELANEPYHVVDPLADLGLGGHGGTLGVVVDGGAQILHVVD